VTVRVRFAPSPTGSLHVGSALTAVANRAFADERGGAFVLRIDDTDEARTAEGAEAGIVADLEWLGVGWDEGPVRQSERLGLYEEAAARLLESGAAFREDDGALRFGVDPRPTLVRADGRPTYQLASVVDDVDLGITQVIRGTDHLANAPVHAALAHALGAAPPEYVHHGLILGADGTKLSKRSGASSLVDLREMGIPPEAVRAYLVELGLPKHDVHYDEQRVRRLAVDALAALSDEELANRAGAPVEYAPALRGARDLNEAQALARLVSAAPEPQPSRAPDTLARFAALRADAPDPLDLDGADALLTALRKDGADLRALRLALTGEERGPELRAVLVALPRDEAVRRATGST
jgi:glutamyl/glutaminyl-tRNA synthetase